MRRAKCGNLLSTIGHQTGDLGHAHSRSRMCNLSVKITHLHDVAIHNTQRPYACAGQISRSRTAEAAGTDDQHSRSLEAFLACISISERVEVESKRVRGPAEKGGLRTMYTNLRQYKLPPVPLIFLLPQWPFPYRCLGLVHRFHWCACLSSFWRLSLWSCG